MIKRIVKLSFTPKDVEKFKTLYSETWPLIRSFKGCNHVELLQDKLHHNVFFTYSIWDDEEALNAYRQSALFESVWSRTKVMFNDKPQAWSTEELIF